MHHKKLALIAGFAIFTIYCLGLFVPLMDYDSAHHADIALHMYLSGNYSYLIDKGQPYLDKPHLLFWLTAISYKIFGVTSFAYRLPSFLFSLLAIYSTYRLAKLLYDSRTGRLAALILATAFAFSVSIYDVRMEGLLTGSVIFATWQLLAFTRDKRNFHLLLAALGLATGFSTKGMVGLAIPVVALLIQLIYERNWAQLYHPKWLVVVLFFALFISPVLYAYYLQFDLHPETVVKGQKNISGTGFILWSQSFKRMSGQADGSNQSDFFFFFHTYLWAFLPWSFLGIYAMVPRIRNWKKNHFRSSINYPEVISAGTVIFFMVLFSFSKFKLPHYLNCLFPFFSVLLANYLLTTKEGERKQRLHLVTQLIISSAVVLLALILSLWAFPLTNSWKAWSILILATGCGYLIFLQRSVFNRYMILTASSSIFLLACFFFNFYPELLKFQAGNQLAAQAGVQHIPPEKIYYLANDLHSPSFDFYSAWLHPAVSINGIKDSVGLQRPFWLYASQSGLDSLKKNGIRIGETFSSPDFRVSVLKLPFLNPSTRNTAITHTYLIKLL